ncbi:hypothetical protein CRUP_011455 [Coryphaenoides rupestris]|nr:hypothetical protein CRUP_011455 [Coryphaenoides rupestris]
MTTGPDGQASTQHRRHGHGQLTSNSPPALYCNSYGRKNFTTCLGHRHHGSGHTAHLRPAAYCRPSGARVSRRSTVDAILLLSQEETLPGGISSQDTGDRPASSGEKTLR